MNVRNRTLRARRQSGFSLIELIVVITIIGILASVVVVSVSDRSDDAKVVKAKQEIAGILQAAELFRLDVGRWPDSIEEIRQPPEDQDGNQRKYLPKMPLDPWTKEPYYYELTDSGVRIYSYGADMQEGGDGVNKDILSDEEE